MFRARYAPLLFRTFRAVEEASFGDFGRFSSILGDFGVGTLPKHTWLPGSRVGTKHYVLVQSALVLRVAQGHTDAFVGLKGERVTPPAAPRGFLSPRRAAGSTL